LPQPTIAWQQPGRPIGAAGGFILADHLRRKYFGVQLRSPDRESQRLTEAVLPRAEPPSPALQFTAGSQYGVLCFVWRPAGK